MPNGMSYSFTISSAAQFNADLAMIDVGGTDAGTGNSYNFTIGAAGFTLDQQLDAVNLQGGTAGGSVLTINGGGATLDGASAYSGFFVYTGTVVVNNLNLSDMLAQGGNGGDGASAGGGGAGLGAGLFIASGGAVVLSGVGFANNSAKGGAAGLKASSSGGGGGLDGGAGGVGNGGYTYGADNSKVAGGGGGGIGLKAAGGSGFQGAGGSGIVLGAAGGIAGKQQGYINGINGGHLTYRAGGAGGTNGGGGGSGFYGGGGGIAANGKYGGAGVYGGNRQNGGFGGGGGAAEDVGLAGQGGFGGGGGGGGGDGAGGDGGFGGGGAGGSGSGSGGFGAGNGQPGVYGTYSGAGGGLGAGADVFVQQGGSLTIGSGTLGAGTVSGGTAGYAGKYGSPSPGVGLGSGLFIQGNQLVTLAPGAGQSLTIDGTIADETGSDPALTSPYQPGGGLYPGPSFGGQGHGTGAGMLAIQSGTVTLDGADTYTGGTNLTGGGEVVAGSDTALGSGTLTMAAGTTLGFAGSRTIANAITVAGAATDDVNAGQTDTLSGVISDGTTPGIVEKTDPGTLTLTGANTYTGGTTIAGGTLVDAPTTADTSGIGTGGVTFAGTVYAPATLALGPAAQPASGGTFAETLTDFGTNDGLDLTNLAYTSGGRSTLLEVNGNTLTVTEGTTSESFTLAGQEEQVYFAHSDGQGGTLINDTLVVCFAQGTRIATCHGEVAVEDLRVGDLVVAASGAHHPVKWIGYRTIDCARHAEQRAVHPVRIAAHAFGEGRPSRDLCLSPGHPVLVGANEDGMGGHLVPIMCLINGTTIKRVAVEEVTYWHVELDKHDILLAEGLPAESYINLGSRPWFDGADGALYDPDMAAPGMPGRCCPVAIDGPVVEAERRRLDMVFAERLAVACAWPSVEDTAIAI